MSIVAGCDVGSLTSKAVVMKNGKIVGSHIIKSKPRPQDSADAAMTGALLAAGAGTDESEYCIGTGYGRDKILFAKEVRSEISCHGKGARWLLPSAQTVIFPFDRDAYGIKPLASRPTCQCQWGNWS